MMLDLFDKREGVLTSRLACRKRTSGSHTCMTAHISVRTNHDSKAKRMTILCSRTSAKQPVHLMTKNLMPLCGKGREEAFVPLREVNRYDTLSLTASRRTESEGGDMHGEVLRHSLCSYDDRRTMTDVGKLRSCTTAGAARTLHRNTWHSAQLQPRHHH